MGCGFGESTGYNYPPVLEAAKIEKSKSFRPHGSVWVKPLLVIAVFGVWGSILLRPERNLLHRATRLNIPRGLLADESFPHRWQFTWVQTRLD